MYLAWASGCNRSKVRIRNVAPPLGRRYIQFSVERQIDCRPPRFLLALALFGLGPVGYYLAHRPSGAPGRLGNLPEPQKNRLLQTKTGNALTSAARWRGLISIRMRPNDQNANEPI